MRVSEKLLFQDSTKSLNRSLEKIVRLQDNLNSFKRVNKPSDDPVVSAQILRFGVLTDQVDQYARNADSAQAFLEAGEATLTGASKLMIDIQALATGALSASSNASTRKISANHVEQNINELLRIANTNFQGQFIFAGTRNSTQPFSNSPASIPLTGTVTTVAGSTTVAGAGTSFTTQLKTGDAIVVGGNTYQVASIASDTSLDIIPNNGVVSVAGSPFSKSEFYNGDSNAIQSEVGPASQVQRNLAGDGVFGNASGGVDIFATLNTLHTALKNNDPAAIRSVITLLEKGRNQIAEARAAIGGRINRLDATRSELKDTSLAVAKLKSAREDADLADVVTNLSIQQAVFQAVRESTARFMQTTLQDFLR